MLGASISCGRGDWRRVGSRSWRMRRARKLESASRVRSLPSQGAWGAVLGSLLPNFALRSSGGLLGPWPRGGVVFA